MTNQCCADAAAIAEEDDRGLLSGILLALDCTTVEAMRERLLTTLGASYDGEPVSVNSAEVCVYTWRDEVVQEHRRKQRVDHG